MIDAFGIVRRADVAGRASDAEGDDGAGTEFLFDGWRAVQADRIDASTMERESSRAQGTGTAEEELSD